MLPYPNDDDSAAVSSSLFASLLKNSYRTKVADEDGVRANGERGVVEVGGSRSFVFFPPET